MFNIIDFSMRRAIQSFPSQTYFLRRKILPPSLPSPIISDLLCEYSWLSFNVLKTPWQIVTVHHKRNLITGMCELSGDEHRQTCAYVLGLPREINISANDPGSCYELLCMTVRATVASRRDTRKRYESRTHRCVPISELFG